MPLIAAVRLRGRVNVGVKIATALEILNLRKKNAMVVFQETPSIKGMFAKAKDFVTYGPMTEETLLAVYKAKKIVNPEKAVKEPKEHNPVHLAPPRKGLKSVKLPVKAGGDLGERKEMDSLVKRMI